MNTVPLTKFEQRARRKLNHTKESARTRGKDFNLDRAYIENILLQKTCAYSGEKFGTGDDMMSLERWDNNKGYVKGNVIPVKRKYNTFRGDLSLEQLLIASRNKTTELNKLDKAVKPTPKAIGYAKQKQGIEKNIEHRKGVLVKLKAEYEKNGVSSTLEQIASLEQRMKTSVDQLEIYEKLIVKEMNKVKIDPKSKVKTTNDAIKKYDMIATALLKFEYMNAHNYVRLKRGLPMIHK